MMSDLLLQATASGIVTGCVYALVALSLVIVYKSTDVVNFAGGELLMLGGYIALLALTYFELSYPLMFVTVIAAMYLVGALFERIPLNTIRGRSADGAVVMSCLAGLPSTARTAGRQVFGPWPGRR